MKATRIRAVTVGVNLAECHPTLLTEQLTHFFNLADNLYTKAHFPIQTRRLTLAPMRVNDAAGCYQIKSTIDTLNRIADQTDIRWLCLPLAGETQLTPEVLQILISIIHQYPRLFAHFMIAQDGHIYNPFVESATRAVLSVSRLSNNGYDNFRVGLGANIRPNTPYFPFSFHQGKMGFSLAVELIERVIQAIHTRGVASLACVRSYLIDIILPIIEEIDAIGLQLEEETGLDYKGQDISLAPFPDDIRSVAALIELLGPLHSGQSGTLMITSLLTDVIKTALKQSGVRHTGFNGVMFSLLEDKQLAKANNQRHLSMEKLMLYSAVCGCGIDMVPVPGDIFEEELSALVLDVAALSTVLNKPLGIRTLPIPLKAANELTNFNHDFLTNTRILRVDGQRLSTALSPHATFHYLRFEEKKIKEFSR